MPEIKQYTRQILPNETVSNTGTAASFGGDTSGLDMLANSAQNLSKAITNVQLRRDESDYIAKMSQFQLENIEARDRLSKQDFEDESQISQAYVEDLNTRASTLNIPESMRSRFEQDRAEMQVQFGAYGMQDQAERAGVRARTNYENTATYWENIVAKDPSQFEKAEKVLRAASYALSDNSAVKEEAYQKSLDNVRAAKATAELTSSPTDFIKEANKKDGEYKDLPDLAKYIKAAKQQIKDNEKLAEKKLILDREADLKTKLANEDTILLEIEEIEKTGQTYDELIVKINEADVKGQIRDDAAIEMRRYITSKKEINAVTDSAVMGDIINKIYDLNAFPDYESAAYLEGVSNIKTQILKARAEGKLGADDEKKLNNQIRTLTSKRVAGATESLPIGKARNLIEDALPPEYVGEATRRLFYTTIDKREAAGDSRGGRKEQKRIYMENAQSVIDEINRERTEKLNQIKKEIINPPAKDEKNQTSYKFTDDDTAFLEEIGASIEDVRDTAVSKNITEKQVIELLKEKLGR